MLPSLLFPLNRISDLVTVTKTRNYCDREVNATVATIINGNGKNQSLLFSNRILYCLKRGPAGGASCS